MHVRFDAQYGHHPRQTADIYTPRHHQTGTVVIFWHGGSWKRGDKRWYRFMGRAVARLGYTVVIPNYRLYPEVAWPVFAEDAALVVAWTMRELAPTRLVAMGHSAGAQIAGAVAFNPRYLAAAGASGAIAGFVGVAGAYGFSPAPSLQQILEVPGRPWQTWQLIAGAPVPSLLMHGRRDALVSASASRRLGSALREHGGRVEVVLYQWFNHFSILVPYVFGLRLTPGLRRRLAGFINSL